MTKKSSGLSSVRSNDLCKPFGFDIYEILIGIWALGWILLGLILLGFALLVHQAHV